MEREQDNGGISRGQNQLHVLPEDWPSVAAVVEPLLDRLDAGTTAPQLLIVTNDTEAAAAISARLASASAQRRLRILAATDERRSSRVLKSAAAHIIVASAHTFVQLLGSAAIKLDAVRAVVLAWVDDLDAAGMSALEALMSEVPKDSARLVLANEITPAVDQLVERYARRAGRSAPSTTETLPPVSLSYVTTVPATRIDAVRRLLDALDPASAFVVVRDAESRRRVDELLRSLGYGESDAVRSGETPDGDAQAIVLFDVPSSEQELRRLVAERASARVIAVVAPRQIGALRRMAGGSVAPLQLPEAAARARSREDALRDELRTIIASGQSSRELLALEPLLSEFDGSEVAAAALRLLETERAKPQVAPAAATPALIRVFVNVGAMDNVRPGDLVGAITNEVGVSKSDVGKVEVRERHSTVEVATHVANTVVSKLTGISIRGRRVLAKVDEERERRGGDRGPRRDDVRLGARDRSRRPPPRGRPRPDA